MALGEARARVIDTPGHTIGHIAYYVPDGKVLACGDTLFSLGCGRLIEGTAADMFASLRKLAALPADTLVCCGHEYTESNARFALTVDPDNLALQARAEAVKRLRAAGQPTVPSRLGDEMAENPFLRANDAAALADIRTRKDRFPVKLFYSATSPYVRKVMACAITRGIDGQIERIPADPWTSPPELLAANPLSKVPCLVAPDGYALFDSPVICEYLDTVGDVIPLVPSHGAARWRALKLQALADGVLDAAILRRREMMRPREPDRDAGMARQRALVARSLDTLESDPPARHVDVGGIAVACALGYLDFRFADEPWRGTHPKLAAWFAEFGTEPGLARTMPS